MKNIHILPTDKPSRYVTNYMEQSMQFQNIYITSDEETKQGENYYYSLISKRIIMCEGGKDFRKIILTTDQDLIADGVQAIDDEFLQWFVKNPSCNHVLYRRFSSGYKIIIPQVFDKQLKEELKPYEDIKMVVVDNDTPKEKLISDLRNEEMSDDYYPPKDIANAIWGACFNYEDIDKDNIREKVKKACFMIEKIYKIQELCRK
jgi:hypothetical protein